MNITILRHRKSTHSHVYKKTISCCFLKPPLASFSIRIACTSIFFGSQAFFIMKNGWKHDWKVTSPSKKGHILHFHHFRWDPKKLHHPSFTPLKKMVKVFPSFAATSPPGLRATSPGNAFRLGFQKNIQLTRRSKSLSGMITIGISIYIVWSMNMYMYMYSKYMYEIYVWNICMKYLYQIIIICIKYTVCVCMYIYICANICIRIYQIISTRKTSESKQI